MIKVKSAKYISDYKIKMRLSDGNLGVVDLKGFLQKDHREIFKELLDKKKFAQFKIDADTVIWKNGADLAPEFLESILQK